MCSTASKRLAAERKDWRKNPIFSFVARPTKNNDGTLNLMIWECGIPGKNNTIWKDGFYKLRMTFTKDYPATPPKLQFRTLVFHPNVSPTGMVCLSIVDEDWNPHITIKQILLGVQTLLHKPNCNNPVHEKACMLYMNDRDAYEERVRYFMSRTY